MAAHWIQVCSSSTYMHIVRYHCSYITLSSHLVMSLVVLRPSDALIYIVALAIEDFVEYT
jgi:hypothetical protein